MQTTGFFHLARPAALRALAALVALALPALAAANEPPAREGLACRVERHAVDGALKLELAFSNAGRAPITLPPGAHLVLYRDAAAGEPMENTARIDRLQRMPLVVPPEGRAGGLFVADAAATAALLCNEGRPAAAGLYFYEFSRRPTFRCVLAGEGFVAALPMKQGCAGR